MKISVVVPVRNEATSLPALLEALFRQTWPPDEILVADGGSTDATAAIANAETGRGVRLLRVGPAYPGKGRNAGVVAARNDWIAFIDAGCDPVPTWLEALGLRAGATSSLAVFGSYDVALTSEWARAQALTYIPAVDPETHCRPLSIASALVHRTAWEKAGRFREDLRAAEDLLFFDGLAEAAIEVRRAPAALVTWQLPAGPVAIFRRFRRYSTHHLAARLARTWHERVMLMDAAAIVVALVGLRFPAAFLLLGVGAGGRLLRTVARRRHNVSPAFAFRPDRLARVGLILLIADAAAWIGAIDFLRGGAPPASS